MCPNPEAVVSQAYLDPTDSSRSRRTQQRGLTLVKLQPNNNLLTSAGFIHPGGSALFPRQTPETGP